MRRAAILMILLGSLVAAPTAAATYDPIGGGTTSLQLDPGFRATLAVHGVQLRAVAGAKLRGPRVTFPVSGGRFDPVASRGIVDHSGSLVFLAGKRKLPLRGLVLKPAQARSPLSAKFGGGKLKIAASSRLSIRRDGFGLRAAVTRIELSAKAATRLGKKLRLRGVFHEGQPFGRAVTTVQPQRLAILPQGRASLVPDPGFLAKLNGLFVSLNPVSPAELAPGPVLTLPIAGGGSLAPDAAEGALKLGGSLEFLQLGGGQIFWAEPVFDLGTDVGSAEVDLQPSPPFPGKLGPTAVLGLLPAAPVEPEPKRRLISVASLPLTLSQATATAFNEAFAKPQGRDGVFGPGEVFAQISFAVQAQ